MTTAHAGDGDDLAEPLDLLLTDAALGIRRRLTPNSAWLAFGRALTARPRTVARRGAELARAITEVAAGQSGIAPSKRDPRFAHPAWPGTPVLPPAAPAHP